MKKLLLLLAIFSLGSCSLESDVEPGTDPGGKWVLVKTTGQTENSEQTGAEMPFQESILFKSDGTFTKTRMVEEDTLSATGTYAILETSGADYGNFLFSVRLEYPEENPIIANCDTSLTEYLNLTTNYVLKGTWEQCDGLGLYYRKIY